MREGRTRDDWNAQQVVSCFRHLFRCANDRHILPDLSYEQSLISAWVESHVFKYADKPHLYFTCTIVLCFKQDGGCNGITVGHPIPWCEISSLQVSAFSLQTASDLQWPQPLLRHLTPNQSNPRCQCLDHTQLSRSGRFQWSTHHHLLRRHRHRHHLHQSSLDTGNHSKSFHHSSFHPTVIQ